MYLLDVEDKARNELRKLSKRNPLLVKRVYNKINEILQNPYHYKPLKAPLQNKRRVHISSFVLIYEVVEQEKLVKVLFFGHHDQAYK